MSENHEWKPGDIVHLETYNSHLEMRSIPGYPGYAATIGGRILKGNATVSQSRSDSGMKVAVNIDGRRLNRPVARLIATAFYGEPPVGTIVKFRDGNNMNLNARNLFWSGYESENKITTPVS